LASGPDQGEAPPPSASQWLSHALQVGAPGHAQRAPGDPGVAPDRAAENDPLRTPAAHLALQQLTARGAPRDQGIAQGQAFAEPLRRWLRGAAAARGPLAWRELRRRAQRGPLQALAYHLVQLHERMEGIALGAGTALGELAVPWTALPCAGRASASGDTLAARLPLPAELAALAFLRRSEPDAAGFASLELALAPFAGCLAGVNERGVAVALLEERCTREVSLRELAQDFLLRASDLRAGLEHLRLRARYAGGSGRLLLAAAAQAPLLVELERGACAVRAPLGTGPLAAPSSARIQLGARSLELELEPGLALRAALAEASAEPPTS
jgi:hypothetical protein